MSLCQCSCASVKCRCSRVGAEDGWVLERLGEPLDCGGVQPAVWQRPAGGGRGTRPWIRPVGTATLSVRKASWKAVSGVALRLGRTHMPCCTACPVEHPLCPFPLYRPDRRSMRSSSIHVEDEVLGAATVGSTES